VFPLSKIAERAAELQRRRKTDRERAFILALQEYSFEGKILSAGQMLSLAKFLAEKDL
jgi:hypothetical protein